MDKQQQLEKINNGLVRMQEIVDGFDTRSFSKFCEDGKLTSVEIARLQHQLKVANERADEVKKAVGKVFDHVRTLTLPDKMDEEGVAGFTVQGVGRVSLTSDMRASIKDKQAGYEWLEEHGHGDLISETVNASSLKALLTRMMRDGEEIPDDIFKVSPFNRASITKA